MRCATCQGPAHPATGWFLSPTTLLCGPCAGRFGAWLVQWTSKRKRLDKANRGAGLVSFYEAAATSIRADLPSQDTLDKME
jgi:hypothetical protein